MNTGKKTRLIRHRIRNAMVIPVIVALLVTSIISIIMIYQGTMDTLDLTVTQLADVAAKRVEWELASYKNIAMELGCNRTIGNADISNDEKMQSVNESVEIYGLSRGNIIDLNGQGANGNDYSDRDYFKASLKGEEYITEPLVSKTTGELSVIISAPIWEDGIKNSKVLGVVFVVPNEDFLNDIVSDIQISKNGGAYILDSTGTVIASIEKESVLNQENSIEDAKTDSSLKKLAEIETKMIRGEAGFDTYRYEGSTEIQGYAPIANTNGWSIATYSSLSDFMGVIIQGIIACVIVLVVLLILICIVAVKVGHSIGDPVKICADRLMLLAQADMTTDVPSIITKDETGILVDATRKIVETLRKVIDDMRYMLEEMAGGNFDVQSKADEVYIGDFTPLQIAMQDINQSLSRTMLQIKAAAYQVSMGSEQMADGAGNLADGAMDQAGAVQELLATIHDVSDQMDKSAKDTAQTSIEAQSIGNVARESTVQMNEMTDAMERISHASKEIANIIQSIEDIASQTNLLSLNASIEAARAGESGRGFAVVAGEIGGLAHQSANAVDETRNMIQTALSEVEKGNVIVGETVNKLQDVITRIEQIVVSIGILAEVSETQANAISQISQGVEQISAVVQNNSATAEESSATSEQLASQAENLDQLISQFTLKDDTK